MFRKHWLSTAIVTLLSLFFIASMAQSGGVWNRGTQWIYAYWGMTDSAHQQFKTGTTQTFDSGATLTFAAGATMNVDGTSMTSTGAELNILDGATATYDEINNLDRSAKYVFYDDFNMYQTGFTEADSPYILNSGSDGVAVDPAIVAAAGGTVALVTGTAGGTDAEDMSNMVIATPVTAAQGALILEARVKVSAITNAQFFVGFSDVSTLELPVTITTTAVTTVMSNGVGFAYDAAATTDQWYCVGVKADTDATGQAVSGVAPTTGYQILKILVDSDGAGATFYINGTLVGTLTANTVTAATPLYPTIGASGDGTATKTLTADYLYVSHTRN